MTIVEEYAPVRAARVDTTFWQHRSPFAGTQEQLSRLRAEADVRAARRAFDEYFAELLAPAPPPNVFELHRPAIRRLTAILHVRLVPLLWLITTCKCGGRWPCNAVKQHYRGKLGWCGSIDDELDAATRALPKPVPRWRHLLRRLLCWARPVLE